MIPSRSTAAALLAAALAATAACGESVITSGAGRLSPGSFNYLRIVFFQEEKDAEEAARGIIELDAQGILADRLGFRKDPSYGKYVILERRRRHQRAAYEHFRKKLGDRFSPADMIKEMRVRPDIEAAARKITANKSKDGLRLIITPFRVVAASWPGGDITLEDLKETMLAEEWDQLLTLGASPLAASLDDNLKRWLYREGSTLLAADTGADEDELERFDHNKAAELFLMMRYGFAEEGIYPVKIMEVDLTPKELIDHFIKIRHRFLPLRRALVQYTAVRDLKTADLFMAALSSGEPFRALAGKYALNAHYRATAEPRFLRPEDAERGSDERSASLKVVLNVAAEGRLGPVKIPVRPGVMIVNVISTEREKKKLRYEDYVSEVRYDLNRNLLRRQFPVDLADTVKAMKARVRPELFR